MLELATIEENTRIPTQLDKFWGSSANKKHLQKFVANTALQMAKEGNLNIVLSGTVVDKEAQPSKAVINHQEYADIEPLKSLIEEADSRIISHIHRSLTSQGYKTFVVLSNDTDVLVLILHYFKQFKNFGIEKVWIRMGSEATKTRRLIPLHQMYKRMPKPLNKVLLATHVGTGCDALSKIGTKLAALNAIPEMFLEGFGTRELNEMQIRKCEEHMVKVMKLNTECKTFKSLRFMQYRNDDSIFNLPPSSFSITQGYIQRWYFLVKEFSNILNPNRLILVTINGHRKMKSWCR